MRAPNSGYQFVLGVLLLALAVFGLAVGATWCAVVGGFNGGFALWRAYTDEPDERADGPDPLRATPAKRFRATGWPPSKSPDDYR